MKDKNKDLLISLLFFFLAFAIRFLLISKGPFHMDTLELARNASLTLDTLKLRYMHWAGYPLTVIMGSVFIFFLRLFGIRDPVFSVNLMSVVFGSLSVAIFYLFSRKILERAAAVASCLIFIFLPLHVSVSTFGMTHPLSIFFNLLSLYLLFLYFENNKTGILVLSSISLGLGTASRLPDGVIIFSVIFLYLATSLKNKSIPRSQLFPKMIIYLIVYGLSVAVFYLAMFLNSGLAQFKEILGVYYYNHSLEYLWFSLQQLKEILGPVGLWLSAVGGLYLLIDKKYITFLFLLIFFASLFVYYGSTSVTEHRYLLLAAVPLLITQGYFIAKASQMKRPRLLFYTALFILVMINFVKIYPVIKFRHDYSLQEDFAKFVQQNTEPSSYVIAMDEGPFIEYYSQRNVLYKATGLHKEDFDKFFTKVDNLLTENKPVYIISSGIYGYDPKRYFINTLSDKYNLIYLGCRLNEDYHHAALGQSLFFEGLYKIEKKV